MEVIVKPDPETASLLAAGMIERLIRERAHPVLGLATGKTPLRLYQELIRRHREEQLDFSHVTSFNLDEYVGLAPEHPSSYHHFMWENLFNHINISADRVHIPNGEAEDTAVYCQQYEEAIREAGGINLQILGLGTEGHVGFNEPASSLASRTRIKTLTTKTLDNNAPFFKPGEKIPRHAITVGVATILESNQCLLLAFGEEKASAVAAMVEGPVTAMVSASALQFHPNVQVIVDEAAASKLQKKDYYRWVYQGKPEWQRYE